MTPSTLAESRSALLELLRAVPAVGVVHANERYAENERGFKQAYQFAHEESGIDAFDVEPHIRGWYLRRTATVEGTTNGRILNVHTWTIRGYLSFQDAIGSELIFDDLVERMRDAVRYSTSLGLPGLIGAQPFDERGMQVESAGPVLFSGVLCHSASLQLKTRNWAPPRRIN